MFHTREKRTYIWAVFALLFLVLAVGVMITIQPAQAALPRSADFPPAATINLSLNGGAPTGFAANADGRAFVRVTTGAGLGYITVEAIGQTSGKRSGSVVQVLDNAPYVPGVTAGPHAVNNS